VVESLSTEDDTLLKCLIDLAETTPKYLRHQLDIVFNLCLKVSVVVSYLYFCDLQFCDGFGGSTGRAYIGYVTERL